jgi:hypothetical protein
MIEFYKAHSGVWEAAALTVGLQPATITAFKAAVDAAVVSQDKVIQARQDSKAVTDELNANAAVLRAIGGACMSTIRAFAETTGDDNVYTIAKIPMPKPPVPVGPPTSPTDLSADPHANGTITLKWKGTIQGNQWFAIDRKVDAAPWVRLDSVRAKTFTDLAVPMNTNMIQYRVAGQRGTVISNPPAEALVLFGNLPAEIQAAFRAPKTEAA